MFDYFYIFLIISVLVIAGIFGLFFYISRQRKNRILRSLNFVLYEITLPQEKPKEGEKNFKELIAPMEQFYSGMFSIGSYFILEIGLPAMGKEIVFYAAVERSRSLLFEKQIQGLFPHASLKIKKEDYNIFRPQGFSLGSFAKLKREEILPIKTYDKFESDPLQVIINTFSKLQAQGEGAALQVVVCPANESVIKKSKTVSAEARKGKSLSKILYDYEHVGKGVMREFWNLIFGYSEPKKEEQKPIDEELVKLLEAKASAMMAQVNLRLLASSENKEKTESILTELESAFSQFEEAQGNGFKFIKPKAKKLKELFYNFSFRIPDAKNTIVLNTAELASVFHFPLGVAAGAAPQLKYVKTKEAPPPLNLALRGLLLGQNVYRGEDSKVYMTESDRRRHFYIIGQTGTGKSVLLKNMIVQDIEAGKGVCFIDPHGSDLQEILSRIPASRADDVIYFNPADTARPMGLNMLEYDVRYPEQKTFIVNELLGIFNKLFDMKTAGGPMFEQYFRNSTLLVMEDPESGNTLFEVARVLADKPFREHKLSRCNNPIVKSFWKEVAEKAGGEASLQNMVPYITSKFDNFLANDIMRLVISQEKSSFNFRQVMDEGKILLVNLSKGRLGDLNANLLGLIIVGKLLMASLSRVDVAEEQRKDFYLYIDEFQNVTTDSIATILSEARKYKLDLTIAHQFIGQLAEEIKKAVFGNVGSMAAFRVGAEDAEFLEKQFEPVFNAYDLINIDNYNAYLKILIDGQVSRPFSIQTLPFQKGDLSVAEKITELSSLKYGRPREQVEAEIKKRYEK
ncbi:MAG: type IV secretion system DNA-binding domain-containing protein [Candidatus Terrybacteria bacterium]|nr:type IV secretion system DNA-binding domain-containing protein [Candidatus Terrybacteria bacterium]